MPAAPQTDDDIESLRDLASGAPVVRAVNDLLEKAVELRATDVHIEPVRGGLILRLRVDGLLRGVPTPAEVLPQAMISRIKILAGLNIAERRLPQDGAAHLRVARSDIDIRVATMPTQYGESAAIRLLPKDRGILEIAKLGLSISDEAKLNRLLKLPHALVNLRESPAAAAPPVSEPAPAEQSSLPLPIANTAVPPSATAGGPANRAGNNRHAGTSRHAFSTPECSLSVA